MTQDEMAAKIAALEQEIRDLSAQLWSVQVDRAIISLERMQTAIKKHQAELALEHLHNMQTSWQAVGNGRFRPQ